MTHKIIKGDPVSQQDIERFIQDHRKCFLNMEKNKVRLDDRLSAEEKSMKLRMFFLSGTSLKDKRLILVY